LVVEKYALFFGVIDLAGDRGHLSARLEADELDRLRSSAQRRSRGVNRRIAAAEHDNLRA